MIYAQIMAGGTGKRMGNTPLPKQFLSLGDKPVIVHTVEKFILSDRFDLIFVSTPEAWLDYTAEIFEKYNVSDSRLRIIAGGAERNDTLMNAIKYIKENNGLNQDDVILVHDAVRPFITKRIIDDNLDAMETYKAVDTVVPAFDTIVRANEGEILEIPIRDEMYQGQTPQTFNIQVFLDSYGKLTEEEKAILSDSAKIVLLAGEKVGIVQGEVSNMKITTPYDLKIANAIISKGHSAN